MRFRSGRLGMSPAARTAITTTGTYPQVAAPDVDSNVKPTCDQASPDPAVQLSRLTWAIVPLHSTPQPARVSFDALQVPHRVDRGVGGICKFTCAPRHPNLLVCPTAAGTHQLRPDHVSPRRVHPVWSEPGQAAAGGLRNRSRCVDPGHARGPGTSSVSARARARAVARTRTSSCAGL